MIRSVLSRLFGVLFGLALGWLLCEVVVGRLVEKDLDGNRHRRGLVLKPYHLPIHQLEQMLRVYHASNSTSVVYHPLLGWDARPTVTVTAGDTVVTPGFRASREPVAYTHVPLADTVRILLFGDSFTQGATEERETWGQVLEDDLIAHGHPVQVLNFGLGGYGIDQAYLRWAQYGRSYSPDIVIFGFQPENVKRNLNLIRMIYAAGTGLPFSKPRFVLTDGPLKTVNSPAVPPDSLPWVLEHIDTWPLARYETYYDPADYTDHWWLQSTLLAFTGAVLKQRSPQWRIVDRRTFDPGGEAGRLALAILQRFHDEVVGAGASFLMVHLPRLEDLNDQVAGRRLLYENLLVELDRRFGVVDTRGALVRAGGSGGVKTLFRSDSHYNAAGNRAVADALDLYFQRHSVEVSPLSGRSVREHKVSP